MDKSKLRDKNGRPLTQGLFLETNYNTDHAVYTLKEEDHEYEGKVYPSIKRLFLDFEDPTEYEFANEYFLGWKHWNRIKSNKLFTDHIAEWQEELDYKMRAASLKAIVDIAVEQEHFGAHKYILEKQWKKGQAGRPAKKEKEREQKLLEAIENDYAVDIERVESLQ